MSNYDDRGAYTPRDEPLAFDARRPHDGGRRAAPTTLILSAAVLLLLAAAVFFYYRSGIRSEGEAPRVVGDPVGEMVSPPPASAQPADPTAGLEIYNTQEAAPASAAAPTFAPEPEQPVARPAPPPAAAVPLRPATSPTPAPAAAAPAPLPARPAPTAAKPAPAAVTPAPAKPAAAPPAAKPASPAPEAPTAATPVKPTTAAAKPAATGGPASVQIGAFSNAAQADKGWNDVARALPGDMAGRGKRVEQADVGGTTFHRTFVTGFASKADAQAFCGKLKAAGKSCIVR